MFVNNKCWKFRRRDCSVFAIRRLA